MLMCVRWQDNSLGKDADKMFQHISNWWWSWQMFVIFFQEMSEPEPLSSALGIHRGATMPRLLLEHSNQLWIINIRSGGDLNFVLKHQSFRKLERKKIEYKSQTWTKLFIKHVSVLSYKVEEFIILPKTPFLLILKKNMTSTTKSVEAGGHGSLLPSCVLLVCASTQPGLCMLFTSTQIPQSTEELRAKSSQKEKKKASESIIAKSTVKINQQKWFLCIPSE